MNREAGRWKGEIFVVFEDNLLEEDSAHASSWCGPRQHCAPNMTAQLATIKDATPDCLEEVLEHP